MLCWCAIKQNQNENKLNKSVKMDGKTGLVFGCQKSAFDFLGLNITLWLTNLPFSLLQGWTDATHINLY